LSASSSDALASEAAAVPRKTVKRGETGQRRGGEKRENTAVYLSWEVLRSRVHNLAAASTLPRRSYKAGKEGEPLKITFLP
jgi:hypothetical protein